MVRRFITVTLLTRVLGVCWAGVLRLAKKSRMAAVSYVPSTSFYSEVRSNDQQNWLRFLNACNKGKLTFSPVDEVVYYA